MYIHRRLIPSRKPFLRHSVPTSNKSDIMLSRVETCHTQWVQPISRTRANVLTMPLHKWHNIIHQACHSAPVIHAQHVKACRWPTSLSTHDAIATIMNLAIKSIPSTDRTWLASRIKSLAWLRRESFSSEDWNDTFAIHFSESMWGQSHTQKHLEKSLRRDAISDF